MLFKTTLFLFLCFWLQALQAQDSTCYLQIVNREQYPQFENHFKGHTEVFDSPAERNIFLSELLMNFYRDGYIATSWTPISNLHDTLSIQIDIGKKIKWITLRTDNLDQYFLENAGYRKKDFENKIFRYNELATVMINLVEYSENHGYPFATVSLDSIVWSDSTISANLIHQKNLFIQFEEIKVNGNLLLNANYLKQYTGIQPGAAYNQQLLDELDNRLKEIPFATVTQSSKIEFSGDRAKVLVFLDQKQTSKFDFIIGVIPNNEITGRLIITGEGRLDLNNVLNAGETFKFHFSKLESTSKELQTYFAYPFLPGLALGFEGDFNLFLRDSAFLERSASIGLLYNFIGNNNIKPFVSFYNSTILTIDTNFIIATRSLPANLDLSETAYGVTWNQEHLNYRFNPRKGYAFSITGSSGTKTIQENSSILSLTDPEFPEFDFASLYDSLETKTLSIKYKYGLQWFIPIFKRNTILLAANGAALLNGTILSNELLRIGGNLSLRGFDDQSLSVSQYHLFTAEIRYLLSQNSYAALFADGGYIENKSAGQYTSDFPIGFGAGINFETKAGIFGLNYALGIRNDNPLSIKNAKIHFGYVNYF